VGCAAFWQEDSVLLHEGTLYRLSECSLDMVTGFSQGKNSKENKIEAAESSVI
jgi:hypothetical protein